MNAHISTYCFKKPYNECIIPVTSKTTATITLPRPEWHLKMVWESIPQPFDKESTTSINNYKLIRHKYSHCLTWTH